MSRSGLFAVLLAAVVIAVAVSSLTAAAQSSRLPEVPRSELQVNKSSIVIHVYSDGCIGLEYYLAGKALLSSRGASGATGLETKVEVFERFTKDDFNMSMLFVMPAAREAKGALLSLNGSYTLDEGLESRGRIVYRGEEGGGTGSYALRLGAKGGWLNVTLTGSELEDFCDVLSEVADQAEFIEVIECDSDDGSASAALRIDLAKLWDELIASGALPSDVSSIARLLTGKYGVKGRFIFELGAERETMRRLTLVVYGEGDVARLYDDLQAAYPALVKLALVLVSRYAEKAGYNVRVPLAALASVQPSLVDKIPFENRYVIVAGAEDDEVDFRVKIVSNHMCYVAASGEPERDAKRALESLSEILSGLKTMLAVLESRIHGASKLIPEKVKVVPGDENVRVEPGEVAVEKLGEVRVVIAERGSAGKRATATTTGRGASAETSSVTDGAGEAGVAQPGGASSGGALVTLSAQPGGSQAGGMSTLELVGVVAAAAVAGGVVGYLLRRK